MGTPITHAAKRHGAVDSASFNQTALLDALPSPVYATDLEGRLTYFNPACARFFGRTPELGADASSVTGPIYSPDGTAIQAVDAPLTQTLRTQADVPPSETIAHRGDGTKIWFTQSPTRLKDEHGQLVGALNMLVEITDHKRMEQDLTLTRQKLERILETDAVAVLFFSPEGTVANANDVFLRMTGYTRDQVERRELHWRRMTPPEWVELSEKQMEMFGRTGRIGPYEKEYFLADGSRKWMVFAGRDLGDGSIVEFCIDIDEQKRREGNAQVLAAVGAELVSEDEPDVIYEKILAAAVAISRADFGSMQLYDPEQDNLVLLALHGMDAGAERRWSRVGSHETCVSGLALHDRARVVIPEADLSDRIDERQKQTYRENGMVGLHSTPLMSRSGKLLGIISTQWRRPHQPSESELGAVDLLCRQAADIVERVQVELAIRQNEAWLAAQKRALQSAVNGASLEASLEHLVDGAVQRFGPETRAAFFLASPDSATLYHVAGMGDEYAKIVDGLKIGADSLSCGLATHSGLPELTTDVQEEPSWQPWLWVAEKYNYRACWSFPLHSSEGNLLGSFAVYLPLPRAATEADKVFASAVTDTASIIVARHFEAQVRKGAEEALRTMNDELETRVAERTRELIQINEQLQGFTYSVAHDLRQQIRGINVNASMLMIDAAKDLAEESKTLLARLVASSKTLSLLVDDLLTYARLGEQDLKFLAIDMTALAVEVAEYVVEQGMCSPTARFRVMEGMSALGDLSMLRIVMQNLIENAAKYSSKQAAPIIEVGIQDDAFFVKDNGIGFDMRFSDKLFQPFERLHFDVDYRGTGIGLANVRRVVERHGGSVWAESQPGEGATFYFRLKGAGISNASELVGTAD